MNILKHLNETELTKLCNNINMPVEATNEVLSLLSTYDFNQVQPHFNLLFDVKAGSEAVEKLNALFCTHEKSKFLWLATSLSAALCTQEKYHAMGISDEIFYDTMGCFSRFVKEHKESYGEYGYDRQFWSYRQLSQTLYRIGTLEFELITRNDALELDGKVILNKGDNVLSIHIPSDGKINTENCHESYKMAIAFFKKYYPDFDYNYFWCQTWLLSPHLKEVLPAHSNILQFQSDFTTCNTVESDSYKLWVFKDSNLAVEDFPEDTSLQRNIKKHIQNGGKIGEAECVIPKSKFK